MAQRQAEDIQTLIEHLRELIDAIDRRLAHIEWHGEFDIATEAAALKARALARLEELERRS